MDNNINTSLEAVWPHTIEDKKRLAGLLYEELYRIAIIMHDYEDSIKERRNNSVSTTWGLYCPDSKDTESLAQDKATFLAVKEVFGRIYPILKGLQEYMPDLGLDTAIESYKEKDIWYFFYYSGPKI